ncbi:hypothetical protein [Halorussus halobius]|nr:hypothetical protein [Halorussus halobius]
MFRNGRAAGLSADAVRATAGGMRGSSAVGSAERPDPAAGSGR